MTETAGDTTTTTEEVDTATTDRTFSQADVDRIVGERLARAKTTPPDDYADLKAKAQRLSEIEAENMSELEKERAARTSAEERATQIEGEAREIRLRSAILAEAAKADRNVVDADSAIALLDRSTLTLDDQGNPTNIAEAMDSLLKAKPFLVATPGGARGNVDQGARGTGGPTQVSAEMLKSMTPDQIRAAEKEGRLHNLMTGA